MKVGIITFIILIKYNKLDNLHIIYYNYGMTMKKEDQMKNVTMTIAMITLSIVLLGCGNNPIQQVCTSPQIINIYAGSNPRESTDSTQVEVAAYCGELNTAQVDDPNWIAPVVINNHTYCSDVNTTHLNGYVKIYSNRCVVGDYIVNGKCQKTCN